MRTTQFDARTKESFTTEIEHHGTELAPYEWHITGDGYYVIIQPDSKHVSFSKKRHDICMGDIVSDIIPDYTNQQYADDYGDRVTGYMGLTVREYMQKNCRMNIK